MKVFGFLVFINLLFPAVAIFQDKLNLLPNTPTPAEHKNCWLKERNKYYGYGAIEDSVNISDLKFDGCVMRFRIIERYSNQYARRGDQPALGDTDGMTSKERRYNSHTDMSFDLKDIDPAKTAMGDLP